VSEYCCTFGSGAVSEWRTVLHRTFILETFEMSPGFCVTVRCQICGDVMGLGGANDNIPADEMRLAKRLQREARRGA
jgi:hypothetical protein